MASRRSFLRAGAACLAAPLASACHTMFGPSSVGTNWEVFERGRFTFYARPSSFAARSIDQIFPALDYQYDGAAAMLEVRYSGHISMYLHESAADGGFASNYSGKAYPDTGTVRATCTAPFDGNLIGLLSHEMNHVITRNALGQSSTAFITEGIATAVIVEKDFNNGRHFLYPWTASHLAQLPSIAAILDDDQWSKTDQQTAYRASASFLAWLIDTRGPAPLKQVFTTRSDEAEARIQSAYGKTVAQLEPEWKAYCVAWQG